MKKEKSFTKGQLEMVLIFSMLGHGFFFFNIMILYYIFVGLALSFLLIYGVTNLSYHKRGEK